MPSSGFSGITGRCQPTWIQILFMQSVPSLNDFSWSPFMRFPLQNDFFPLLIAKFLDVALSPFSNSTCLQSLFCNNTIWKFEGEWKKCNNPA